MSQHAYSTDTSELSNTSPVSQSPPTLSRSSLQYDCTKHPFARSLARVHVRYSQAIRVTRATRAIRIIQLSRSVKLVQPQRLLLATPHNSLILNSPHNVNMVDTMLRTRLSVMCHMATLTSRVHDDLMARFVGQAIVLPPQTSCSRCTFTYKPIFRPRAIED